MVIYDKIPKQEIEKGLSDEQMKIINHSVQKMRFPKKTKKDTIIYNSQIRIENIPNKAYEYIKWSVGYRMGNGAVSNKNK